MRFKFSIRIMTSIVLILSLILVIVLDISIEGIKTLKDVGLTCYACYDISDKVIANFLHAHNVVKISVIVCACLLPLSIIEFINVRRTIRLEEQLPLAFRLIADSLRAGTTLERSIEIISQSGLKPLSPLLSKALALSRLRGLSITQAIEEIGKKIKCPELIRFSTILDIAARSGVRFEEILDLAAKTTENIQVFRRERYTNTQPYVIVAYLVIVVYALLGYLVSMMLGYTKTVTTTTQQSAIGNIPMPIIKPTPSNYIIAVMHYVGLVQAIASSLIIGKVIYDRPSAGLIHGVIMIILLTVLNYIVFPVTLSGIFIHS